MKLKHIILEELEKFKIEGVGDKYAERKWGIPDPAKDFERQHKAHKAKTTQKSPNGEYIGDIEVFDQFQYVTRNTPLFLNPQSLHEFDPNTRALSDNEYNLFVALYDDDFYHNHMGMTINEHPNFNIGNAYEDKYNIQWNRVGETNNFGFSSSYVEYARNERNKDSIIRRINELKRKHHQFNFIPRYWEDIIYNDEAYENDTYNLSMYFDEDYFNEN